MPEPLKNLFNESVIRDMAQHFQKQWPAFDAKGFISAATKNLDTLELKERASQITAAMRQYLPDDFTNAADIMLASLGTRLDDDISAGAVDKNGIAGWAVMPMSHYVGLYGHDHFDLSMTLLKEMTKRFSSEFAIRFFLLKTPEKTLSVLKTWVSDPDQHVRRLVSEGTRPRLPWAMQLPMFITDPVPVIELLESLKDDEEEYVRRSVANNLNDIAKDHPDLVADIAGQWLQNASRERQRLVRHACRTLLKNGHPKTLQILGYESAKIRQTNIEILTPLVEFGSALQFNLSISSDARHDQALMIDYVIHHRKANGSTSAKVFKWKDSVLAAQKTLNLSKKHIIKKITTRVYYPGTHKLEIMVNGVSAGSADFELLI